MPTAIAPWITLKWHTPETTGLLVRIAEAKATITASRVLPPAVEHIRGDAKAESIHYSTLLEGNTLDKLEAEKAIRGDLDPKTRMQIELANYVQAIDLVDARIASDSKIMDPSFIKELHGVLMKGLGREGDPHFKPHHEGDWRDGYVVIKDELGAVVFEGPEPAEVPLRVEGLCQWVDDAAGKAAWNDLVIASFIHHTAAEIHPFADGNGRMSRLLEMAWIKSRKALPIDLFSLDRYYAEDKELYKEKLSAADSPMPEFDTWVTYHLTGVLTETERALEKIKRLDPIFRSHVIHAVQLNSHQEKALVDLSGRRSFTVQDYMGASGRAKRDANRDLYKLRSAGVINLRGTGKASHYVFGTKTESTKSKWSNSVIEELLREFVSGRSTWPTAKEFKAAGHDGLYQAMSRNGGVKHWRSTVGL